MHDPYGHNYESVAGAPADRLIPDGVRRLAGAAVFLGLIAAMGLWAYRLGTRDAAELPVIQAMEGPARMQPDDPGGLEAAHQGLEVNSVLESQPAPTPRATVLPQSTPPVLAEEDAPIGELVVADHVAVPDLGGEAGDVALRVPPQDDSPEAAEVAAVPDFTGYAAEALPLEPDGAATEAEESDAQSAAPRPRGRPAGFVVARAKTAPAAAPAPPPSPPPAQTAGPASIPASAPAAQEVAQLSAGTRLIQLGAFDSEAMTRDAWRQLVARHGDLLGPKSLYVERATSNARVFYRLRVSGFESAEQTRVMCESLRARAIDCIPVTLQ